MKNRYNLTGADVIVSVTTSIQDNRQAQKQPLLNWHGLIILTAVTEEENKINGISIGEFLNPSKKYFDQNYCCCEQQLSSDIDEIFLL